MNSEGNGPEGQQRRCYQRVKAQVSVEIRTNETAPPMRLSTDDISLGGCYVQTMFTFDVGAKVLMTLWLHEEPVRTNAVVVTRHPQFGNGFSFVEMSADDIGKLGSFITAIDTQAKAEGSSS